VLARSLGVGTGETCPQADPAHYQAASLLVHPSRSEGLPCVLVEALLSGCPVIATDVGGISELVSAETGALVEPDNAEALAQAIARGLEGQWSPESLRQRALPFSWQASGPALIAHTLELIGRTEDEA
jgi:glycosyltransferase involved in cell wall biosynthesis